MQKGTKKAKSKKPSSRSGSRPSPDDYQMVLLWSEDDQCDVHGRLTREAEREGLNQWILTKLAG